MAARLEAKNHEGHSAGAQNGNQNALGHGLVAFRNGVHRRTRRGRSLIDRRSNIGREALSIQASYVDDLGGEKALTTGQRVVLGLLGQNLYLLGRDRQENKPGHQRNTQAQELAEGHGHALQLPRCDREQHYPQPVASRHGAKTSAGKDPRGDSQRGRSARGAVKQQTRIKLFREKNRREKAQEKREKKLRRRKDKRKRLEVPRQGSDSRLVPS